MCTSTGIGFVGYLKCSLTRRWALARVLLRPRLVLDKTASEALETLLSREATVSRYHARLVTGPRLYTGRTR